LINREKSPIEGEERLMKEEKRLLKKEMG